jgi:glycosyltransferase involved in cell wall biosynthesis
LGKTVSLIVRCFNEEAHIGRLLTGVERQTRRPDEIIIVDSGSTDATVSIAASFDRVTVVPIPPEQFSFGHALNVGVGHATSDICVFASAHVYPVYDTWIEHLIAPFADDLVALTYGRQQTPPNGRFSECRLLEQWFPPKSVSRQRDPFCNNANAAIRRSVWEDLPYDEALTGLEDLDWARRALERGLMLSYVAEAPIIHVHHETFGQVLNRYRREAIAHKAIYHEQNMTWKGAMKLLGFNVVGDLREAARAGVVAHEAVDIVRFRTAQFLGTYQGFRQSGPVTAVLKRRFYYPSTPAHVSTVAGNEIGRRIEYEEPAASP